MFFLRRPEATAAGIRCIDERRELSRGSRPLRERRIAREIVTFPVERSTELETFPKEFGASR
jgi:hypothetical protein